MARHFPEPTGDFCTSLSASAPTMSTEEPKPESPPSSGAKAEAGSTGDSPSPNVDAAVVWPPPEAAPGGEAGAAEDVKDASQPASTAPSGNGVPATVSDSGVMTAPEPGPKSAPPAASGDDMPAATPQEEMGLSNSTLHWLEDGEQAVPGRLTEPGSMPSYDPRAPVPGRKRGVLVVGLAGVAALILAAALYGQAQSRKAAEPPPAAVVEPARDLTNRAQAALAANQIDHALELAHLALTADARFADAHFVVGTVAQGRNQAATARDAFRKYLELAPLGTHAEAARKALATLPP